MTIAMTHEDMQIMNRLGVRTINSYQAADERDYWAFRLSGEFGKGLNAEKPVTSFYTAYIKKPFRCSTVRVAVDINGPIF